MTASPAPLAADALLGLLFPFWQLVIGIFVVLLLAVSVRRLARRGRSRMTTALLVSGAAAVAFAAVGILAQGR
jgi:peptidoglycan/LPS O-acetylase OafA/YrhL